jgi:hypothetical protein
VVFEGGTVLVVPWEEEVVALVQLQSQILVLGVSDMVDFWGGVCVCVRGERHGDSQGGICIFPHGRVYNEVSNNGFAT